MRHIRPKLSCLFALALAIPALMLTGCNSLYKPAAVTTLTAEKAMTAYGSYFDQAIANPTVFGTTEAALWAQRNTVDECWERYRATMNVADDARQDYVSGVGDLGAVKAALNAARENSAALTEIVVAFLPYSFQPKD